MNPAASQPRFHPLRMNATGHSNEALADMVMSPRELRFFLATASVRS
jgi:hypothetical protein